MIFSWEAHYSQALSQFLTESELNCSPTKTHNEPPPQAIGYRQPPSKLASSPGHSQLFQRATLKSWEWPGDEATSTLPSTLFQN